MSGKKGQRMTLRMLWVAQARGREPFPAIEIGCLNTRAHRENGYKAVHFKIKKGQPTERCPICGRRAGRPDGDKE